MYSSRRSLDELEDDDQRSFRTFDLEQEAIALALASDSDSAISFRSSFSSLQERKPKSFTKTLHSRKGESQQDDDDYQRPQLPRRTLSEESVDVREEMLVELGVLEEETTTNAANLKWGNQQQPLNSGDDGDGCMMKKSHAAGQQTRLQRQVATALQRPSDRSDSFSNTSTSSRNRPGAYDMDGATTRERFTKGTLTASTVGDDSRCSSTTTTTTRQTMRRWHSSGVEQPSLDRGQRLRQSGVEEEERVEERPDHEARTVSITAESQWESSRHSYGMDDSTIQSREKRFRSRRLLMCAAVGLCATVLVIVGVVVGLTVNFGSSSNDNDDNSNDGIEDTVPVTVPPTVSPSTSPSSSPTAPWSWLKLGDPIDVPPGESSNDSTAVLAAQNDTVAIGHPGVRNGTGLLRVYSFTGNNWVQVGGDLVGTVAGDRFGQDVGISHDGRTVVSCALAVGVVRAFRYDGVAWTQLGQSLVAVNNTIAADAVGCLVTVSGDGSHIGFLSGFRRARTYEVSVYDLGSAGVWERRGMPFSVQNPRTLALSSDGIRIAMALIRRNAPLLRAMEYTSNFWQTRHEVHRTELTLANRHPVASFSNDTATVALGVPYTSAPRNFFDFQLVWVRPGRNNIPWSVQRQSSLGIQPLESAMQLAMSGEGFTVALSYSNGSNGTKVEAYRAKLEVSEASFTWTNLSEGLPSFGPDQGTRVSLSLDHLGNTLAVGIGSLVEMYRHTAS